MAGGRRRLIAIVAVRVERSAGVASAVTIPAASDCSTAPGTSGRATPLAIAVIIVICTSSLLAILVGRELVIRMGCSVVVALEDGKSLILFTDSVWLQRPAGAGHLRNDLMVVLLAKLLDSFSISRTIQHERVHWSRDVAILFLGLLVSIGGRPVHPCIHVSDRNSVVFCQRTEGLIDDRSAWLSLTGSLLRWPFLGRLCSSSRTLRRCDRSTTPCLHPRLSICHRWWGLVGVMVSNVRLALC